MATDILIRSWEIESWKDKLLWRSLLITIISILL